MDNMSKNKIVNINGRFLTRRITGVDRFAVEILYAIDSLISQQDDSVKNIEFRVFVPQSYQSNHLFENIEIIKVGKSEGQLWEQYDLLRYMDNDGLLLNLCNTAPLFCTNQLVVIHDIATIKVPESYSFLFRTWYKLLIPNIYKRSKIVCTVSKFSKSELEETYGTRSSVRVLPEGVDHIKRSKADETFLETQNLDKRPYVLAVSSLSPHKNFEAVIKAVELLDTADLGFDVVIAGGQNPSVFSKEGNSLPPWVKYLGYVSDEELKALYEGADCFIFPSIYEGYGLPPTEAMACGCPVLVADAASIPEVCMDAGVYFDPYEPKTLANKLQEIMNNDAYRKELSIKGRMITENMHWSNTARTLLNEIEKVD